MYTGMSSALDRKWIVRSQSEQVLDKGVFREGRGPWPPMVKWPQIMEDIVPILGVGNILLDVTLVIYNVVFFMGMFSDL